MSHNKIRYTSDMTDAEWELIKPMLPLERTGPGRPIVINMREAVNAMFYVDRTGCQWQNLPNGRAQLATRCPAKYWAPSQATASG